MGGCHSLAATSETPSGGGLTGLTFDAGGLIALDRNDRRVIALIARAEELGLKITIPATALAQAIRNPARQARLMRFIRQVNVDLQVLDAASSAAVGRLLAVSGTADIADAHVVLCAVRTGQTVVTSDAGDILALAPEINIVRV